MKVLLEQAAELRAALKAEMPESKFEVRANSNGGWDSVLKVKTNLTENWDGQKFWSIASRFETNAISVYLEDK